MNPTLAAIANIRSPFHGAVKKPTYTKKHRPLVWESMLGTVCALKPGTSEAKYFDYNYEAARAYAEVDKCTDLRLCRVKDRYQGWPARGKLALFGIPPAE